MPINYTLVGPFVNDAAPYLNAANLNIIENAVKAAADGVDQLNTDYGADRILFWDDSAGAVAGLTPSTGLTLSGTNLTVRTSSTTQTGIVELATTAEAAAGTDTARAVTPEGVAAYGHQGFAAVNTVAASGATETLSGANALHKVTMDQNCTFTFTSPSAGASFALLLSGAFTPTFPATVDWPDGTAPTYSSPSVYVFTTWDAGTTWYGVQAGKAFA